MFLDHRQDLGAGDLHGLVLGVGDDAQPSHVGVLVFVLPGEGGQVRVELKEIVRLLDTVPTLVCVNLERPAVLPEIAERAGALLADYGASDTALLDVAFGRARAEGRLPFELPRSMATVESSRPDVPDDTPDEVFPYGHGLSV